MAVTISKRLPLTGGRDRAAGDAVQNTNCASDNCCSGLGPPTDHPQFPTKAVRLSDEKQLLAYLGKIHGKEIAA